MSTVYKKKEPPVAANTLPPDTLVFPANQLSAQGVDPVQAGSVQPPTMLVNVALPPVDNPSPVAKPQGGSGGNGTIVKVLLGIVAIVNLFFSNNNEAQQIANLLDQLALAISAGDGDVGPARLGSLALTIEISQWQAGQGQTS